MVRPLIAPCLRRCFRIDLLGRNVFNNVGSLGQTRPTGFTLNAALLISEPLPAAVKVIDRRPQQDERSSQRRVDDGRFARGDRGSVIRNVRINCQNQKQNREQDEGPREKRIPWNLVRPHGIGLPEGIDHAIGDRGIKIQLTKMRVSVKVSKVRGHEEQQAQSA